MLGENLCTPVTQSAILLFLYFCHFYTYCSLSLSLSLSLARTLSLTQSMTKPLFLWLCGMSENYHGSAKEPNHYNLIFLAPLGAIVFFFP